MLFKSKHSLFLLSIFCIVGSAITTAIVSDILHLHLIISTIIFVLFSAFLIRKVYTGNIRSILCDEKEIVIHYEEGKSIPYTDIQAVLIKADVPRRVNSRQRKRVLNFIIVTNNQGSIVIPYVSFSKDIYEIVQYIHERNPNVMLDMVSLMPKEEFYQTLSDIENCRIKPAPFIRNTF